ncbi:hypothetical protein DXU93_08315 [Brumimicrobium aurantiacum]|uniref:Uncharacterized protein n=1 Tax=Brumimicrobium aurantiacum TaxID=1737063 RepID=A0A3E1EXZ0_9FLAO|nr:hypothetical protein DXU93_08315 [Brumimicrobium aurantiacum]
MTYFTNTVFRYEEPAFLKLVYLLLLVVTISILATLDKSENATPQEKQNVFNSFVFSSVTGFFSGWVVHLYFVIQTVENKTSFMQLESEFWIYHCADLTLVISFAFAALMKVRPAIHK